MISSKHWEEPSIECIGRAIEHNVHVIVSVVHHQYLQWKHSIEWQLIHITVSGSVPRWYGSIRECQSTWARSAALVHISHYDCLEQSAEQRPQSSQCSTPSKHLKRRRRQAHEDPWRLSRLPKLHFNCADKMAADRNWDPISTWIKHSMNNEKILKLSLRGESTMFTFVHMGSLYLSACISIMITDQS